jgi:hypothetical protein
MLLTSDFLAQYYKAGDPFKTLLARATYLSKYSRLLQGTDKREVWTDTIRRVVEGNCAEPLVFGKTAVDVREAEALFDAMWNCAALAPGRGLWTGGVPGIPVEARFNCVYCMLRGVDDWCWTADQLMCGSGVGVGLQEIGGLPAVVDSQASLSIVCRDDHADATDVAPDARGVGCAFVTEDTRQGWVASLRETIKSAFRGTSLTVDVSKVRARGTPIKTFGGVSCGPGPLASLLRNVWRTVRGAVGRRMTSVECLDVTNFIGLCIKSGNVRRSALIVFGDADDTAFRNAKSDWEAVKSHRHTSNNSIIIQHQSELEAFDWRSLADEISVGYGEPGIANMALIRKTDPGALGLNPCFSGDTLLAVADGRNAVSIRQLADEGKDVPVYSVDKQSGLVEIKTGRHPRVTGYQKSLVRVWLDDGSYVDTTPDHAFILLDGSPVKAEDLKAGASLPRFRKTLQKVVPHGKDYYLMHCDTRNSHKGKTFEHRLVAKYADPEEWDRVYDECKTNGFAKTGGLVVHHKDYNPLNNAPENLQIMSFRAHAKFHAEHDTTGEQNGRWSGFSQQQVKDAALELTRSLGRRFTREQWASFAAGRGLPQAFSAHRSRTWTVLELARACAAELGYEFVNEDPRVVTTYTSMMSQGYEAKISDGGVIVTRKCEGCQSSFDVHHSHRERSFCSLDCSQLYINSDSQVLARRAEGVRASASRRMADVRADQARICSSLMFRMGRNPNRKEWSAECKKEGVASRIGPTLTFGYRFFSEVLDAATNYNHKVARVEVLPGEHTVYNITVDDHHTVGVVTRVKIKDGNPWFDGIFITQCGEIPLFHKESCNLAEFFPAKRNGDRERIAQDAKLLTRYCIRQRLAPVTDPVANEVSRRNMRVGVGLGGACDFDMRDEDLRYWRDEVRAEANRYADELGVSRPVATTTCKPSGTISLVADSSPGVHAPYAKHYIRRLRLDKDDALAGTLDEAGVASKTCVYDSTGRTIIFEFPVTSPATVTVHSQSLRDQFERQARLQEHWANNAVSATISYDETEKGDLAAALAEYVPRLKSTSCLPKAHGYAQAPYEAIESSEYEARASRINLSHPLTHGELEDEACAGGACPVDIPAEFG